MAVITEAFQKLKSNLEFNDTFDALIQQRHNAVRGVLENNGHALETKLIGSLQRKTRIQPQPNHTFDIDILVILGDFYNWLPIGSPSGISPDGAMQRLHEAINESDRYSEMSPQQDQPTVSFQYGDGTKVELVPAYLDKVGSSPSGVAHSPAGRAYWIPKGGIWVLADYDHEAAHISLMNEKSGGYLIPTIKMLKAIKRLHISELKSFHLEIVAADLIPPLVQMRRNSNTSISYPDLITDFFKYAGEYFKDPRKIPDSHSEHCFIDLLAKPAIMNQIEGVKKYCIAIQSLSSDTAKMEAWRTLFGDPFPTRI